MGTEINAVDAAEMAVESGFDADGNISDENMAAALTGGEIENVVVEEPEADLLKVDGDDAGQDAGITGGADDTPNELKPTDKDVPTGVMSKNGDFIIPYDDLMKERDGRHTERERADGLQGQLDAANKRLAEVSTPVDKDLAIDPEPGDQGGDVPENQVVITKEALDEMVGDYPQAGAAIMALVKSNELLVKQVGDLTNQSEQNAVTSDMETHFNTIADAHKDYETILNSDAFTAWVQGMPGTPQAAYQRVLVEGDTAEVISMLDDFTATTTGGDDADPEVDKADADKKIAAAEAKAENDNKAPVSLSDIPGDVQPHDEQNALMEMAQGNYMDKMSNLSAADQLAVMDKML